MATSPDPIIHLTLPSFAALVTSPWGDAPTPAHANLADLLFRVPHPAARPVVLGTLGDTFAAISLGQLRHAVARLVATLDDRGLSPGDTVALLRLPATSEAVVATAYAACTAAGLRVLLPMVSDEAALAEWLRRAEARAVLWSATEVRNAVRGQVAAQLARLERVVAAAEVPAWCLDADLGIPELLREPAAPVPPERVRAIVARSAAADPCLILTTSGSTGAQRLVRYAQRALLRSCAAWDAAGLLTPERLGGRNLCPLFAHSMGVRAFWNALAAGEPVCLIPPEWFQEHPERVRELLRAMKPQQVWGGAGVHRVLLELWRAFPDLASDGLDALRRLVSIGVVWDPTLAAELEATLGLSLDNGFGMTEALQVTTTVAVDAAPGTLGVPLPGVTLGLTPSVDTPGAFDLHVASPFAALGVLGEPDFGPWIATGDVVERGPDGLRALGRAASDFFKDAFGVKVSRRRFADLYADLGPPVRHVEPFPLGDEPGLAALVFVGDAPLDARLRDRVEALLLARTLALADQLDETELRHLSVDRLACVAGEPPRTAKGNVARGRVLAEHGPLVARLTGPWVLDDGARRLDRASYAATDYERYAFPRRGAMMRLLQLDVSYSRADGDQLTREGGDPRPVVDGVGGFGGNLLGHRHPDLLAAAQRLLVDGASPTLDQGAVRPPTGRLAKRLSALVGAATGDAYVVRFGSTGAEAVEMALAHALLEREDRFSTLQRTIRREFGSRDTEAVSCCIAENRRRWDARRPVVLAIAGGHHGSTLATRALGTAAKRREGFEAAMGLDVRWLPADGAVDLDALLATLDVPLTTFADGPGGLVAVPAPLSAVAAAVAEPVLGEGGVIPVDGALLARLATLSFPLVVDEIQTGLGRTGTFLASEGVAPAYVVLGKALGGGLAKVSALLVERTRYVDRFDDAYASTFAGDRWSSELALATLDVIERDDVPARARERGAAIGERLERVRRAFPTVLTDVRGRGLLWAVDLDLAPAGSFVLRALEGKDLGTLVVASWLLHRHGVRLLPTLGRPRALRFQPSAFVTDTDLDRVAAALEDLCGLVARGDAAALLSVIVDPLRPLVAAPLAPRSAPIGTVVEPPAPRARQVGFIAHFVEPDTELALADGSLATLGPAARTSLAHRLGALLELEPAVVTRTNLLDDAVHLSFLMLPAPAFTLRALLRSRDLVKVQDDIQRAVDRTAALGCEVVALGAYTSILTRNGRAIAPPPGVRLTTGNSLTVAVGARRVEAACRDAGLDPAAPSARLAIVGATGNIGRALAHRLLVDGPFRHAVLIGRDRARLDQLRAELQATRAAPLGDIALATDLTSLRAAAVVVVATNASEPLIHPWHLAGDRPTIVADVSVPGALDAAVRALPQVRSLPLAGVVPVPGEPTLRLSAHTAPGTLFCCAAEALCLALAPDETASLRLTGDVDPVSVRVLEAVAVRHGLLSADGAAP